MIENIQVETDHWFERQIYGGSIFSWTLAARLGHMLNQAEHLFGARDSTYTILGVEFGGDIPRVRYLRNWHQAIVQITPSCATDTVRACHQMAYQCIHLLSPTDTRNVTVLEEGLAIHFSRRYIREHLRAVNWLSDETESHSNACMLVEQLLTLDPAIICSVRRSQPTISHISPDDIRTVCSNVPTELATALTQPFV